MHARQFREYVVRPALAIVAMDSPAAVALVMGTAAQESGMGRHLRQVGGGPALGVFQMEPATYRDIWDHFLNHQPGILGRLHDWWPSPPLPERMITDLMLAAVMCRIHYRRVREPLPAADDLPGLARYWKKHYNTPLGAGTEAEFIDNWHRHVEEKG
ncbi:MAG: hypothetical protein HQL97_08580 [Magnetococcales bacterium]|nr:hypothetical protein [Magnetococcales bacterium]